MINEGEESKTAVNSCNLTKCQKTKLHIWLSQNISNLLFVGRVLDALFSHMCKHIASIALDSVEKWFRYGQSHIFN